MTARDEAPKPVQIAEEGVENEVKRLVKFMRRVADRMEERANGLADKKSLGNLSDRVKPCAELVYDTIHDMQYLFGNSALADMTRAVDEVRQMQDGGFK